jgi:hypothetical protein
MDYDVTPLSLLDICTVHFGPGLALEFGDWRFRNISSAGNKIVLKIGGHESKFRNPL